MILTSDLTTLRDIDLRSKMATDTTLVDRELSYFQRIPVINQIFDVRWSLALTIDADGREDRTLKMSKGKNSQRGRYDRSTEDYGGG